MLNKKENQDDYIEFSVSSDVSCYFWSKLNKIKSIRFLFFFQYFIEMGDKLSVIYDNWSINSTIYMSFKGMKKKKIKK